MSITYKFGNQTHTLEPNETGMYLATGIATEGRHEVSSFTRRNNGAWKGQYKAIRGGNTRGRTYMMPEMLVAYLSWVGAEAIELDGQRTVVVKAERAETAFGDSAVERMFANYTIVRQYRVLGYRLDFYIPELNI